MSNYKTGETQDLYNYDTGKYVGTKNLDGSEQLVATLATDPLTGGGVIGIQDTSVGSINAVQNLRVASGAASASVYFDPPKTGDTGAYQITTSPATNTTTATIGTTVITGLTNGTSYTVTVTPINTKSGVPATSQAINPKAGPAGLSAISGLTLWYDASQEAYSNGNSVPSLTDWSGSGYSTSGVSASNPTFLSSWTNAKPAVVFTAASSQFLKSAITQAIIGSRMTVFCVFQVANTTGNKVIFSTRDATGPGASQGAALDFNGASLRGLSDANAVPSSIGFSATTPYIASFAVGNNLFLNGQKSAVVGLGYAPYINGAAMNLHIGSNAGTGFFNDVTMGEMLIFNRELTQSERWSVEAYLAAKFNISVVQQ
jgi:hypothetical protein